MVSPPTSARVQASPSILDLEAGRIKLVDMGSQILIDYSHVSVAVWRSTAPNDTDLLVTAELVMAAQEHDQEFVEYIARNIVNHPDDVKTDRIVDERGVLITLHINPEDMGYVIGRQGQTARSLRTLLKIVGAKANARVNLKIYEPEGSRRPPRARAEDGMGAGAPAEASVDDLGI